MVAFVISYLLRVKGSEETHLEGLKVRAHPAENLRRPCC